MGVCIGGKACRRQACKDRCRSWYSGMTEVERACKRACEGNSSLNQDEFMCSDHYYDHQLVIAKYGIDMCPGVGPGVDDYLDPLKDRQREDERLGKFSGVIAVGGVLIVAALIVLYFAIRK